MNKKTRGDLSTFSSVNPEIHHLSNDILNYADLPRFRPRYSYRGGMYRYLHHQNRVIGLLKVRLLAAKDMGKYKDTNNNNSEKSSKLGNEGSSSTLVEDVEDRDNIKCNGIPNVSIELKCSGQCHKTSKNEGSNMKNHDPSWRKEKEVFEIKKGFFEEGSPVLFHIDAFDVNKQVKKGSILLGNRSLEYESLGHAIVDLTDLIKGDDEVLNGNAVMDIWVPLSPPFISKVHLLIEYEPWGMDPEVGDLVYFEAFARKMSSSILPPNEPFLVQAINGSFLLLSYIIDGGEVYTNNYNGLESGGATGSIAISQLQDNHQTMSSSSSSSTSYNNVPSYSDGMSSSSTASKTSSLADAFNAFIHERTGYIKVHRNAVFVIERKSLVDGLYDKAVAPVDYVFSTSYGKWVKETTQPVVNYASVMVRPAVMTFKLSMTATRLAFKSAMVGIQTAAATAYRGDNPDTSWG